MLTNDKTAQRPKRKTPDLEPAYGELRPDYDHRRVQAEFFRMVYFHAQPADIEEFLRSMHALWIGSVESECATVEERRRRTEVVNDLCRIIHSIGKNVSSPINIATT